MSEKTTNIQFDDGFQKVTIDNNPDRTICWNPGDINFIDRFLAFQDWVEKDFKQRLEKVNMSLGPEENRSFDSYERGAFSKLGEELNKAIDACFGTDVSGPAFCGANPITPTSSGYIFMNFFNALMPLIEKSIKDFEGARKKYTQAAKQQSANPIPAPPQGRKG